MSHLDPEARKVLALARAARTPSAADKQRVRSRIVLASAASLAANTAHAATSGSFARAPHTGSDPAVLAQGAAKPSFSLLGVVKLCVASATVALAAASYVLVPSSSPAPSRTPTHAAAPLQATIGGEATPAAEPQLDAGGSNAGPATASAFGVHPQIAGVGAYSHEAPGSQPPMTAGQLAAASTHGHASKSSANGRRGIRPARGSQLPAAGTLERELDLLHGAQAAWRAREADRTLVLLEEHAREYPRSALRDERGALRVLALCELGRVREARRLGEALIRRAPGSPVRTTIEESCAFE